MRQSTLRFHVARTAQCLRTRTALSFCRIHESRRDIYTTNYDIKESTSSTNSIPGLFQLPNLKYPHDFQRLTDEVKTKCRALQNEICSKSPSLQTVYHMDAISNEVCSVIDAAELCRNVHPNESFRAAAAACFTDLSDFIQQLNANVHLYRALRAVTENKPLLSSWTPEQQRMAILLRQEFERDGIHLSHQGRQQVISIQNEITQLSMDFQRVLHASRTYINVPATLMKRLPHGIVSLCERNLLKPSVWKVPTDLHVMNTVLKWIPDPHVRKEMYIQGNSCATDNLEVLDALRLKRHQLAELLGFKSYAQFAMSDRMMTCPEAIERFVRSLANQLRPKAQQEYNLLATTKRLHEKDFESQPLAMWDLPYYMGMLKAKHYRIDSRVISSYFPLERCLEGLHLIVRELFGLQLVSVPMKNQYETWHSDVRKLALRTLQGSTLGYIYFDLYPRPDKYNHAAHFTIRCGKQMSHGYQKPVVALVCNFHKPAPSSPSLLTHSEVETLFHEFGHAMHSLLSRTEFQHVSGTRTSLDFVETPSHLFEYFAWDYRVVHEFARHYKTNEAIPIKMMENLNASKHMFSAMDAQTQCFYSLLDLSLFHQSIEKDSTTIVERLQNELTMISHVPGTYWHTRFGHLIGYGAGYYSYLYSRVFASEIWHQTFSTEPLNTLAGQELYHKIMIHGGAKDPNELLRSMIGHDPTPDSYLKELGITY